MRSVACREAVREAGARGGVSWGRTCARTTLRAICCAAGYSLTSIEIPAESSSVAQGAPRAFALALSVTAKPECESPCRPIEANPAVRAAAARTFAPRIALLAALAALPLAACAQTPSPGLVPHAAPAPSPAGDKGLSADVFYRLLLGDVALQRGETSLAARAYFEAARDARDPRLAQARHRDRARRAHARPGRAVGHALVHARTRVRAPEADPRRRSPPAARAGSTGRSIRN